MVALVASSQEDVAAVAMGDGAEEPAVSAPAVAVDSPSGNFNYKLHFYMLHQRRTYILIQCLLLCSLHPYTR